MPHEFREESKKSLGDKLEKLVGKRGEYPPDRAERIAQPAKAGPYSNPEDFTGAPARQVGNHGTVIK